MSSRHQVRFGRRLGRDRAPIDAAPAPPVGETLQLARERKGVDLYRAERDTRIRLRYIAALEDSDWNELPAPVYTKGFLRNYAIYLGLEPDDIVDRWRDEMESLSTATRDAVAPPPMPIVEPGGRRVTITPGMFVAGLVALVVFAFVGYIAIQLLRFAETTEVALTNPPNVFSTVDAEQFTLAGSAGAGARINITGPGGQVYSTNADELGAWSQEVPLARGRNDFSIVATDPVTDRPSDPLVLTITVPLPTASPAPTGTGIATPPAPITLALVGPTSGLVTTDPSITISGTTTGTRITIASTYMGEPGATAPPSALPSPSPDASADPSAAPVPVGPQIDVTVTTGSFSETLVFPVGQWQITVTSFASGLSPVVQEIGLTVMSGAPTVLELTIQVIGRQSWLRVFADGTRVAADTVVQGEILELTAENEFCVRAGNAGALTLILNDTPLGILGAPGEVGAWLIRAGQEPQSAPGAC